MSYLNALREFTRLYRAAGGKTEDPLSAVREVFAAYDQARVFAEELQGTFVAERAQAAELRKTLETLQETHAHVEQSEQRFRALVSNASDAVVVVGSDNRVAYVSSSVTRVWGQLEDAVLGDELVHHVHPDDAVKVALALQSVREMPGQPITVDFRVVADDDSTRYIEAALTDLGDEAAIAGVVLNARDVTERMLLQEELRGAAYRDPLTGLPNRALFTGHLEQSVEGHRDSGPTLALLVVDLDRFKVFNDTLGHEAGDDMLIEVSRRIRELAPPGSFIGRLGGDEFAMLVRSADPDVPERLAREVTETFGIASPDVSSVSVGVALLRDGCETPQDLFRAADLALFHAKHSGRGQFAIFDPERDGSWRERLDLEAQLRGAVERGEFHLRYQPIVSLADERLIAVEALVRWVHPERGAIPPTALIPLAEEGGMIPEIGRWVLTESCRQLAEWNQQFEHGESVIDYISVNVSAAELRDPAYAERVSRVLRETGTEPARLQLEITESLIVEEGHESLERLNELKELGVRLAIDDFGTGYSSLSYLTRMPVDILKVDRSFVGHMLDSDRVESVVRATISLAHALDLSVVAEGVETVEQQQALRALGCELAQGFYYSRPLSADGLVSYFDGSDGESSADLEDVA